MNLLKILLEATAEEVLSLWLNKNQITKKDVEEIEKVTTNQNYKKWLGNLVKNKILKTEDINKFKNYLTMYGKYVKKYPIKDIYQIKTLDSLEMFKDISIKLMDLEYNSEDGDKFITPNEILKLEEVNINYIGVIEGYQLFVVRQECKDNKEAYKRYKNILGRCSGGKIEICTIANNDSFNEYLETDELYVIYNHNNPYSPYQIHFDSSSFLDRMDKPARKSLKDDTMYNLLEFLIRENNKSLSFYIIDLIQSTLNDKTYLFKKLNNEQKNIMFKNVLNYTTKLDDYGIPFSKLTPEQRALYLETIFPFIKDGHDTISGWGINVDDLTPEEKNQYIDVVLSSKIYGDYNLKMYGLNINDLTPKQKKVYIYKLIMFDKLVFHNDENISLNDLDEKMFNYLKDTIKRGVIKIDKLGLTNDEIKMIEK